MRVASIFTIMVSLVSVLVFLFFGLLVGAVARLIMPGHERGGWVFSMVLGIGGAIVGGFLGHALGFYGPGEPAGFIMSVLGAMVLVGLYHAVRRRAYA